MSRCVAWAGLKFREPEPFISSALFDSWSMLDLSTNRCGEEKGSENDGTFHIPSKYLDLYSYLQYANLPKTSSVFDSSKSNEAGLYWIVMPEKLTVDKQKFDRLLKKMTEAAPLPLTDVKVAKPKPKKK